MLPALSLNMVSKNLQLTAITKTHGPGLMAIWNRKLPWLN